MIPFDFVYCRPDSLAEALDAYYQLTAAGKQPLYYAGGSEIITLSRAGGIKPGAVIDIKQIPECGLLAQDDQGLTIGAACTLNQIKEADLFPLLSKACGRIADHTNQCRITLGGNLCGSIIYRETSLPLLLAEAKVSLYGQGGLRTVPLSSVFHGQMRLDPGELIVRLQVPAWALAAPHRHSKRAANEKIDYPLVSLAALWQEGLLRIAVSGLCSRPFRSRELEAVVNDHGLSCAERADQAGALLPEAPYDDGEGSGAYRLFVFGQMLQSLLEDWEHDQI